MHFADAKTQIGTEKEIFYIYITVMRRQYILFYCARYLIQTKPCSLDNITTLVINRSSVMFRYAAAT